MSDAQEIVSLLLQVVTVAGLGYIVWLLRHSGVSTGPPTTLPTPPPPLHLVPPPPPPRALLDDEVEALLATKRRERGTAYVKDVGDSW